MQISVDAWSAWAPGLESPEDWHAWAGGEKHPEQNTSYPALSFLEPMFKRRLSQLSRMVLHVGNELMAGLSDTRVVFASHYGEIGQQYKISRSIIESGEVAPASFSLSVFNTPVALLSITTKNHGYSTALFGGSSAFETALLDLVSHIQTKPDTRMILIVADELMPEDYAPLVPGRNQPYAFGLLVSNSGKGPRIDLSFGARKNRAENVASENGIGSLRFLSWYLKNDRNMSCELTSSQSRWIFTWS